MSPLNDINRRAALKLLGGGLALSLTSCGKPAEEIVPYVDQPERMVPGVALRFATTLDLSGYGRGALVTSVEGRPIKIEGNPRHPASLGATDVFAEADVLGLYDPDRSKAVRGKTNAKSWEDFTDALRAQMDKERQRGGAGLRIVSGRVTSPTLARQREALLTAYPRARWIGYEPVSDENERKGAELAFGRSLVSLPRLKDASVVIALDSDFLGPGPAQIVNARGFADARNASSYPEKFLRLYAVESSTSATGANADHRLALRPELISHAVIAISAYLNGETPPPLPGHAARFVEAAAADLKAKQGRALVLVGTSQPPEIHALAHWINSTLDAPVDLIEPVDDIDNKALQALAADIRNGAAETLLILDANPAYDAPPQFGFGETIRKLPFSAHLGLHGNETAALCHWHLPLSHTLESWSDRRAINGTASVVQPLIRPLYDTRTAHEVLAMLGGALTPSSYEIVRATWQPKGGNDFEGWWRKALHDGVIANTHSAPVVAEPQRVEVSAPAPAQSMTLKVTPDVSVWDGRFANNAWLQECPKPLTKEVWGNTIALALSDAAHLDLSDGDVAEIELGEQRVRGPVRIDHGQADGVIAVSLGYGRSRAGAIGNGIGFDAYPLRAAGNPWLVNNVTLRKIGTARAVPTTQHHFQIDGEVDELLPQVSLIELAKSGDKGLDRQPFKQKPKPTFYPPYNYDTYAWAMVVDAAACIGCNACVVACQAENNVAVVGPEEIEAGRDMHWLRVDTYESAPGEMRGFQPVPCMQCEHAPCEPVCPVAASVHDSEGLNVQVYNRCVGTRFCQSNCPYKVRRFNWYGYADGQEYKNLGAKTVTAQHNPNVTVRARGVMEKCTYCVQRISAARRDAEKQNRTLADGEVVTACQSACPTRAISFGNRNDPKAAVNKKREEKQHYALLGHLGTRPRTTYLARLTNPNPALKENGA